MDKDSFRKVFAAYLNEDRFRKFVNQLNRAGRLRYWQEVVWNQFVATHPEFSCNVKELCEALHICEIHGDELWPDEAKLVDGNVDYSPSYNEARSRLFPYASSGPVYTEGLPAQGDRVRVWYCVTCRAREAAWRSHWIA